MRASDPPVHYLVGTPKGRLSRYEKALLEQPWQAVREGVQVKLLAQEGELYVLAESKDRVNKERAMRRRQLKGLGKRLKELAQDGTEPRPTAAQTGRGQKPVSGRLAAGGHPSAGRGTGNAPAQFHVCSCARTNCARCASGRGVICCAATSARKNRRSCGSFTFN